ncbi:ATP-dependent DNA helicase RecG [Botrimarina hoheduenensis]|uniref:ATP-dependent DNA helicase RecG n=1 Tax=Botrimarina hoheduenensis TaxID=2528000 RepID=A0A5C5VXM7_9BACT|nr:ATP-dependent DNA helicase RecG [Botrimarina hoheduenensis]
MRLAESLERKGLRSVADLLFCFPREYEDFRDRRAIADLEADVAQTIVGEVIEVESKGGFGKSRVGVVVEDQTDALRAMWFNQAFMRDKFHPGQRVQFSGKPKRKGLRWEMVHPRVAWLEDTDDSAGEEGLLAVYSLTEGVSQHHMRRLVAAAVTAHADTPTEVLPAPLRDQYGLPGLADALRWIHAPRNEAQRDTARRRFIFQELLVLQLALAARRLQHRLGFRAPELAVDRQLDARIRRLFPFELTAGQEKALAEVATDLALDTPMNRLVQGDVGSGKTVVALYALLACVANGYQAVLLAPTEILARQHAATLASLLKVSRVRSRLLVGGLAEREKAEVRAGLVAGDIDLAIGTHALLQEKVRFAKLGLAVIDEQHKFGVRQRAALRQGQHSPHYLVMTATPIPRTLCMTQFGDLDVSVLDGLPPGRQPVSTYVVRPAEASRWWEFVRKALRDGRQAYVVAPLVEESDATAAASVEESLRALAEGELADFRLGLLHGRMNASDKDAAMEAFRLRETQVLVSTTVIEVGVDVANATIMTVVSPECFGLSQLHQLRGRVGRGMHAGYCGLLVPEEPAEAALQRIEAFAATTDGFALAELDFRMRGPGDLFGERQSGLPPLHIADLARDGEVLVEARNAAADLFATDPGLKHPDHAALRRQMLRRYGASLDLGDVG